MSLFFALFFMSEGFAKPAKLPLKKPSSTHVIAHVTPSPAASSQKSNDVEEAVSLDGPTDGGDAAIDLSSGALPGTASVSANKSSSFNPYLFERNRLWIFLPIGMLLLITLHLIAYPYIRVRRTLALKSFLPTETESGDELP